MHQTEHSLNSLTGDAVDVALSVSRVPREVLVHGRFMAWNTESLDEPRWLPSFTSQLLLTVERCDNVAITTCWVHSRIHTYFADFLLGIVRFIPAHAVHVEQ